MKSERLQLLWHHGDMLGFIGSGRRRPWLYFGDKYKGMKDLSVSEAVEIYMTEVIDKNPLYRTNNSEIRERYKAGILCAAMASKVEYVPDSTPSGDVICRGCYQFKLEKPDYPGCVRRKR